ncbi:unnamed protein product, partial [Brassica rapa subsp. trilocularis]
PLARTSQDCIVAPNPVCFHTERLKYRLLLILCFSLFCLRIKSRGLIFVNHIL